MSPEQCRGELVDRRSDIFSLGTLLWELTTGRKLFSSNSNDLALLQKVEKAEITPPSMVVPNYPSELEEIVLKAMARDREKRFKTALELRMAIEEFAHTYRVPLTSTRVSSYMDAVFPTNDRRLVAMTSSMPSLRVPSPLELAVVPTAQLTSGPTKTVVAAHPNEHSPEELPTGVESADTTDVGAPNEGDPRKKPFPVWIAAVAAAIVFGLGGYAMAPSDTKGDPDQAKAAALAKGPEPAPDPAPDPAPEAPAESAAELEPEEPDALVDPVEDADAARIEDTPSQPSSATGDAPGADSKPAKVRRRRKSDSATSAPAVAESKPGSEPGPVTEPTPTKPSSTKPSTKRKSDGVFLPSRNKQANDPTPGRRKPSADDFL